MKLKNDRPGRARRGEKPSNLSAKKYGLGAVDGCVTVPKEKTSTNYELCI